MGKELDNGGASTEKKSLPEHPPAWPLAESLNRWSQLSGGVHMVAGSLQWWLLDQLSLWEIIMDCPM